MESSILSPIPSDQGSLSSVALETPVGSGTLPVIPSIQPLNSRAPEDDFYDIHWNPVWEPSEEDIPFTPPVVSVPMSSSDMDDTSPITSEASVVMSAEIPISAETPPFSVTPFGVTLPLRYRALRDVIGSRTSFTGSMWDHNITPTSGSFIPQIHNTYVTSVPTIPTVCAVSSMPVVSVVTASSVVTTVVGPSPGSANSGPSAPTSRVVDPTLNTPPSSGSIPAGGHTISVCKLSRIQARKVRSITTIL